jgi:hypothetical protein
MLSTEQCLSNHRTIYRLLRNQQLSEELCNAEVTKTYELLVAHKVELGASMHPQGDVQQYDNDKEHVRLDYMHCMAAKGPRDSSEGSTCAAERAA